MIKNIATIHMNLMYVIFRYVASSTIAYSATADSLPIGKNM